MSGSSSGERVARGFGRGEYAAIETAERSRERLRFAGHGAGRGGKKEK